MLSHHCLGLLLLGTIVCSSYAPESTGFGTNFSISVPKNISVEAGLCVEVLCKFTYPPNTITEPYRRVWFRGNPLNPVFTTGTIYGEVGLEEGERHCSFRLNDAQERKSDGEYRFKLEWGQNEMHVFSAGVFITVTALSSKPELDIPSLTEGKIAILRCTAPGFCTGTPPIISWRGNDEGLTTSMNFGLSTGAVQYASQLHSYFNYTHHNTVLTCVVLYMGSIATETSVTLVVQYTPRMKKDSHCIIAEHLLTCTCVSHGVPFPIIQWQLGLNSADYNTTASLNLSTNTVTSTITTANLSLINNTVECVSENPIGKTTLKFVGVEENCVEKERAEPGNFNLPWIVVGLSVTLNALLLSALMGFAVAWKRNKSAKQNEARRTYMSLTKRNEAVYDTINQQSSEG